MIHQEECQTAVPQCPSCAPCTCSYAYYSKLYTETILITGILIGCFIMSSLPTFASHVTQLKSWLYFSIRNWIRMKKMNCEDDDNHTHTHDHDCDNDYDEDEKYTHVFSQEEKEEEEGDQSQSRFESREKMPCNKEEGDGDDKFKLKIIAMNTHGSNLNNNIEETRMHQPCRNKKQHHDKSINVNIRQQRQQRQQQQQLLQPPNIPLHQSSNLNKVRSETRIDDILSNTTKYKNTATKTTGIKNNNTEHELLKSALELFMKHWNLNDDDNNHNNNTTNNNNSSYCNKDNYHHSSSKNDKVVKYMSPKEMIQTFFNRENNMSNSMSLYDESQLDKNIHNTPNTTTTKIKQMIHLFQQIHTYSVNTSHPFFFNQLFGTLDPIALAAEVLALTLHTSPYTWEIAPIVSLIEREVMIRLGKLVFEGNTGDNDDNADFDEGTNHDVFDYEYNQNKESTSNNSHDDNDSGDNDAYNEMLNYKYDGLMLPGGSLSNLTAIHLARHYYLHGNRSMLNSNHAVNEYDNDESSSERNCKVDDTEEKKEYYNDKTSDNDYNNSKPQLVGFVSSEAHYSFQKAASVTGIGKENLIAVPTLPNGQMDVDQLDLLLSQFHHQCHHRSNGPRCEKVPFFVAATSGSTVRGSFDDIEAIVQTCRKHEEIMNQSIDNTKNARHNPNPGLNLPRRRCKIWIHVDGAWGGSAIFSTRNDMKQLMRGVQNVDSFTFNPHKLLGAPQQTTAFISRYHGISKAVNSCKSKYLFDDRKNGAEFDVGDGTFTCARKSDALKLWSMWKYYGSYGFSQHVESKVDSLKLFVQMIQNHDSFMLACMPWPFNVNFFYLPDRIKDKLQNYGIDTREENPIIPDEVSDELAKISVALKLKLHRSGEMFVPYQPLSNQKADCFRIVLAGNKFFQEKDFIHLMNLMEKFGNNL